MEELRMTGCHSRPRLSNGNPYSESLFRTTKYCPRWPSGLNDLDSCRIWANGFVKWYNNEHWHSQIKFVTPVQKHSSDDNLILESRMAVCKGAKARNPLGWSGKARDWAHVEAVHLNPEKAAE
jgi:putative transposase